MEEKKVPTSIILLLILIFVATSIYGKITFHRELKALTSINPRQITMFKIYPGVIKPVGRASEFTVSDPLIGNFFESLTDLHSYRYTHDTVASQGHSWFLEIATKNLTIQISFHIPSGKGDIVAGQLVGFGWFQSEKLFQWYQKYKDRWLKSGGKEGSEEGKKEVTKVS